MTSDLLDSLPPVLRHLVKDDQALDADDGSTNLTLDYEGNNNDNNNNNNNNLDPLLPIIDLQGLNNDDEDGSNKKNFDEACKHWGLFRLVNHGIPPTLLRELHEEAKKVFSLSYEEKQSCCDGSPVNYFWSNPALTPSGTAVTSEYQSINLFEAFNVPFSQLSQFHPQLPAFESFRTLLVEYGNHLSRIGTTLFETMVKNLELKLEASKSYLDHNTGYLRVYRYPCSSNPDAAIGMEVHTDSSVLTILNQEDVAVCGLEVLKDDQWHSVKPISNTLIVNIGDLMQAMSDDRYKSAVHRVKINKRKERVSMGYFVFTGDGVEIKSSKYKPFTYDEFRAQVQQDVKDHGTKIGLSRFKLTEDK